MTERRISIKTMKLHVLGLCAFHKIDIEQIEDDPACAVREFRIIEIPPVTSAKRYATALHEIGHILGAHQDKRSVLTRERWAWRWANRNALVWMPTMERHMKECLAWYEANESAEQARSDEISARVAAQRAEWDRLTEGVPRRGLVSGVMYSPPKRSMNESAASRVGKQKTTKSLSSRRNVCPRRHAPSEFAKS